MAKDLKELFARKVIPVSFERTINLFGATTIGVGALMGAGVYVLIGLAAGKAGPSVWLSYVACGALAFVTTLMFAELARRVPRSGGGYTYAYETLGSFGGFATGWFLALGSIFACGLYAIGFAEYFSSLLGYDLHKVGVRALAIGFVLFSTWINARGTSGTEKFQGLLTWGNLGVLLVFVLFAAFHARPELLKPHFPNGLAGTFSTIGIIYISFFGYQLIANNADEIIDPKRTVPRAMILSMGIALTAYLLIALVSVMAVPWQELAKSSTPLVEVAILSFGPAGWLLISVGGVLASAGALNSTLLSQARQIYAMGKNRFFPALLGEVHQAYKTPFAALFAGGLLVVLFLMLFPLEFIAKAANFCLLVSLLPVSLALRRLYREQSRSNGEPVTFWKNLLPEAALVTNLGLLTSLDWVSLLFGGQLGLVGVAIYFFYSRKRETRSREGFQIVLEEDKTTLQQILPKALETRILLPVANPATKEAIFKTANALLRKKGGEIIALHVVLAPEQMDFYTVLSKADHSLELMERISDLKPHRKVKIRPVIRASRSLPLGIVHAAEEEGANLIVMGYSGLNSTSSSQLIDTVLNKTTTDLIFLRTRPENLPFEPRRIAVALGGGDNLPLMVRLAGSLAEEFSGRLTFLNLLPLDYTLEQQEETGKVFIEAIQKLQFRAPYTIQVLPTDEPLETLVEMSQDFDLLVVGSARVGLLRRTALGSFAVQLSERAACDVAIVRKVSVAQKLVKGKVGM